jgi:hypothetical protein
MNITEHLMYILVIFIFLVLYLSERIKNEKLFKINKELLNSRFASVIKRSIKRSTTKEILNKIMNVPKNTN